LVIPNYLLSRWSDWDKFFYKKPHSSGVTSPGVVLGYNAVNKGSYAKSTLAYRFFLIFKILLFLQTHINSAGGYLGRMWNFLPELKLYPVFKKVLNSEVKI
jgi:hypothetical protein